MAASGDRSLPENVQSMLADPKTNIVVSAAVVWEISIKRGLGKLTAPTNIVHMLEHAGMSTLSMSVHHAELVGTLPAIHRDPFDRMLVAQAIAEGMPIITTDDSIARYDVETIWN